MLDGNLFMMSNLWGRMFFFGWKINQLFIFEIMWLCVINNIYMNRVEYLEYQYFIYILSKKFIYFIFLDNCCLLDGLNIFNDIFG